MISARTTTVVCYPFIIYIYTYIHIYIYTYIHIYIYTYIHIYIYTYIHIYIYTYIHIYIYTYIPIYIYTYIHIYICRYNLLPLWFYFKSTISSILVVTFPPVAWREAAPQAVGLLQKMEALDRWLLSTRLLVQCDLSLCWLMISWGIPGILTIKI